MLACLIVFLPIVGALISVLPGNSGKWKEETRDRFCLAVTLLVFVLSLFLPLAASGNSGMAEGSFVGQTLYKGGTVLSLNGILSGGLHFTTDGFRAVYGIITALMWAGTSLFSLEYFKNEREHFGRYRFFVLVTLGATEGVMLSADLMTAFVFFEILSFTSFTWVIHEETKEAISAGYTYLFIAVIGGLVLFMGLLLLQNAAGTLRFDELPAALAPLGEDRGQVLAAAICILFGFGCKAGMFPVHVWLPKAHPVAPSPGSALLSGILTKVGIYGILMTSVYAMAGEGVFGLIILITGAITMVLGALLAVFSVNLKRTLACSSMSQIGFILTGTGMYLLLTGLGSEEGAVIALSGTMLHMVNHSLIKLTLFMAAGVVVMNLHTLTLDDIRGWGRSRNALKLAFALGALGISGVPMFNGYISKTLLHEGIVEGIHETAHAAAGTVLFGMSSTGLHSMLQILEWVFLCSGGLTFGYMLKLFICVFVEKNADPERQARYDSDRSCMDRISTFVIVGSSLLMVILGQNAVMTRIAAYMTGSHEILEFRALTPGNLKGGLISLAIGAAVYLLFIRLVLIRRQKDGRVSYVNLWPKGLDLEELLYRPLLTRWLPGIFGSIAAVFGENKILTPVCKSVLFMGALIARIFADSTDALIVLLRRTVVREKKAKKLHGDSALDRWWMIREGTTETVGQVSQNFTFALFMTCIGIVLIVSVLFLFAIH